jgi:hypothetical protein
MFSGVRELTRWGVSSWTGARLTVGGIPSRSALTIALLVLACAGAGCRKPWGKQSVRPRSLGDVPAERLAYRFEPDTNAPPATGQDPAARLEAIQNDFDTRRKDDALVRTVLSPDRQRALALYETGDMQPGEFRIDLYGADGTFLRNVTPPELSGAFAPTAAWSPDGNHFAFLGRKSVTPQPTPTPPDAPPEEQPPPDPNASPPDPNAVATVAPLFAPVPVFNTEQIYVCNRDGYDLRSLTTREGLLYFYFAWAPDSHALAALACREDEWEAREATHLLPAGRPRLVELSGQERLLDDALAEAPPVWSPDSSKVATAFETDVAIYDAVTGTPTSARIKLREPLLLASVAYDEKKLGAKKRDGNSGSGLPVSFNPIVRLEWLLPETLFIQTGFVRKYPSETVTNFMRWHALHLSPQAALLS